MDKMTPERDAFAQLVAAIDAEVLPGYREGALPGSPADIEGLLFDLTSMFISTELGGEVGEALNVAKKLTRERLGWGGSRSTLERLAEELGDVVIVTAALAAHHGIDLQAAVASKFNDAQDRWGRDLKIAWPPSPEAAQALTILQAEREAQDRELARVETAALNLMAEKDAKITTLQGERDRLREALEHEMRDVATEASRYREALKMIAIRAPDHKPEVCEDLDNRGDIADQASALATWECSQIALAALQAPFKEGSERD